MLHYLSPASQVISKYNEKNYFVKEFLIYFRHCNLLCRRRSRLPPCRGRPYRLTSSVILKIGMKREMTMPPITTPRKAMTIGSMSEVSPETAASTCSS